MTDHGVPSARVPATRSRERVVMFSTGPTELTSHIAPAGSRPPVMEEATLAMTSSLGVSIAQW